MIYCGTCGFSYDDWVGVYYPKGISRTNRLSFYAEEFNTVELNSTYYALPKTSVIESIEKKTPAGFRFTVKANRDMTHQRIDNRTVFELFGEMLKPLTQTGKLGCVLAQFPYSFVYNADNQEYLKRFCGLLDTYPVVIEFRNSGWINETTLEWMRRQEVGFCCVDEPALPKLLPALSEVTSSIGYIRFHGRNSAKWWCNEHSWERYDYSYKLDELKEWLPRIAKICKASDNMYIFANNHWKSQAVNTIRQIRSMLDNLE
jgi:uncharacterized protein YecE (DUF72 family)